MIRSDPQGFRRCDIRQEVPIQDLMTATGLADDPPLEIPADPMIDRWIVALRRRTDAPAAAFLLRQGDDVQITSVVCDGAVTADELPYARARDR